VLRDNIDGTVIFTLSSNGHAFISLNSHDTLQEIVYPCDCCRRTLEHTTFEGNHFLDDHSQAPLIGVFKESRK